VQALPGQTTPEGVPSFKLVLVGDGRLDLRYRYTFPRITLICKAW